MPNAGKKKNLKPKKAKIQDSYDFARGFLANVGEKNKAIATAKNLELASRKHAMKPDTSTEEAKEANKTANFWMNIQGHLGKL